MSTFYCCWSFFFFALCFLRETTASCPSYPPTTTSLSPSDPLIASALSRVETLISDAVSKEAVPGFVLTVVYDQQVFWFGSWGRANPFNSSQQSPPTKESVVRIASITKTFTDVMLFKMRDQGLVTLQTTLSSIFPSFSMIDPYNKNYNSALHITLRQLASHSSGIQRELPCTVEEYPYNCTQDVVLARLAKRLLIAPPNTLPHYSNLGFALLGRALEKVSGTLYEDYIQKEILDPLGMTSCSFDYNKVKDKMAVSTDYLPDGTPIPAQIQDLGWANPIGGLFCSSDDMAKYISFFFRTYQSQQQNPVLDINTMNEMFEPVLLFNDDTGGFGLPWEFYYTSSMYLKSKAGLLQGYISQLALAPPIKLGVFAAATSSAISDLTVWTVPVMNILIPAFEQALKALQPPPSLPINWKSFLGRYALIPTSSQVYLVINVVNSSSLYFTVYNGNTLSGSPQQLTAEPGQDNVLRIHGLPADTCRWLDDGTDSEFMYFTWNADKSQVIEFLFQEQIFRYVSLN